MLTLNTLRTKFGVILSVVIGGALLAFILSLKTEMGFSGNDPEVGEIAGEEVLYSEFLSAYEDVKLQMGGEATDHAQANQMISTVWQTLLSERVLNPDFEALGIAVGDAEYKAILQGSIHSNILNSIFADPKTGLYNPQALNDFLAQSAANPQINKVWSLIKKQIRLERAMNKYMELVSGGAYANTLTVNEGVAAENNTYKGHFVACKYYSMPDSLVSVSKGEMKRYYKAHKAQYKQTPFRTISYVTFDIEPTDADKKAIEEEVKIAGAEFAKAKDVKAYSRDNRHASIADVYVTAKSLASDEAKALAAGRTFGPKLQGDEWYASRVVESRNAPDSIELKHIVLNYTDDKLADSLFVVARKRGADFEALAQQYSIAESGIDGGALGKVAYSSLSPEFADALRSAQKGAVVKVAFGNVIQIFKVVSTGRIQRHYRLATLTYPVEASQETRRNIHNEASLFSTNANGSIAKFEEAATAKTLSPSSTTIEQGSRDIYELGDAIEVIRWANEAKVGDVSDLIKLEECYVVAVVTDIDDKEYKEFKQVEQQIKNTLLKEKKFDLIKEKMSGATLEEIAENAGSKVEEFDDAKLSSYYVRNIGVEPRVLGYLATTTDENKGALSPVIEGASGAFVVVVDEIVAAKEPQTIEAEKVKAQAQAESMAPNRAMFAIQQKAEIKDNTVKFF